MLLSKKGYKELQEKLEEDILDLVDKFIDATGSKSVVGAITFSEMSDFDGIEEEDGILTVHIHSSRKK